MDSSNSSFPEQRGRPQTTPSEATEPSVGDLVSQAYESAPAPERRRLIEHLLQPLSLLAMLTVANGIFAKLWFRRGFEDLQIRLEDTQAVSNADIAALVSFVQQVSAETIMGLGQLISSSPTWSASAAGALLIATLARLLRDRPMEANRVPRANADS